MATRAERRAARETHSISESTATAAMADVVPAAGGAGSGGGDSPDASGGAERGDREVAGETRDASSHAAGAELLSRTIAADELDEDPSDEPAINVTVFDPAPAAAAVPLGERLFIEQAARRLGLLEAAEYAETNWGNKHVARGIREKAARL